MSWMLFQIERQARERDERNRAWRMKFEIARALRECSGRCRDLAARSSIRQSISAPFAALASRLRRASGRSEGTDCCGSTAAS